MLSSSMWLGKGHSVTKRCLVLNVMLLYYEWTSKINWNIGEREQSSKIELRRAGVPKHFHAVTLLWRLIWPMTHSYFYILITMLKNKLIQLFILATLSAASSHSWDLGQSLRTTGVEWQGWRVAGYQLTLWQFWRTSLSWRPADTWGSPPLSSSEEHPTHPWLQVNVEL